MRSEMDEAGVYYEILETGNIEREESFQTCLTEIRTLYESSPAFQEACNKISAEVLENRVAQFQKAYRDKTSVADENIDIRKGVEYLFKLLAFRLAAPEILKHDQYAFLYYEDFPLLADLIDGKYGDKFKKSAAQIGQIVYSDPDHRAADTAIS